MKAPNIVSVTLSQVCIPHGKDIHNKSFQLSCTVGRGMLRWLECIAARQEWSTRGGGQGWGQARTPPASFYQAAYQAGERAIHWAAGLVSLSSSRRPAVPAARS